MKGSTTTGAGPAIAILHRDLGPVGWDELIALLSSDFTVHAVTLPGFGDEPLPAWVRSVAHLAALVGHELDHLGPLPLVGLGFGGWIAAEIAAYCPSRVAALALVSPLGIKPAVGEVADQFLYSASGYASLSAGTDELATAERLDRAREVVTRVAWKPIGHDPALAPLLAPLDVPAALVWGADDKVVPTATANQWSALLRTEPAIVAAAPHHVERTHPGEVAAALLPCLRMATRKES